MYIIDGGKIIEQIITDLSLSPSAGAHSLSVRYERQSIKHYRIQRIENGWHYISPRLTFQTLTQLVEHYSGKHTHTQINLI